MFDFTIGVNTNIFTLKRSRFVTNRLQFRKNELSNTKNKNFSKSIRILRLFLDDLEIPMIRTNLDKLK